MIINNNVVLFKLNEEKSSISLNILNYGYFPELCFKKTEDRIIFKNLKKLMAKRIDFIVIMKYLMILLFTKFGVLIELNK